MTIPGSPLVSIIVPVFNGAGTVAAVIDRLLAIDFPASKEIIVVNDGSTDGTRAALERMPSTPHVQVIHADRNRGKGHAVQVGLARARGSVVAIQDADLELDPAQLPGLVMPILRGEADVIYGSRFLLPVAAPFMTIAGNRLLTGVTNLLFGSSLTDMETCYKVIKGDVARGLAPRPIGSISSPRSPRGCCSQAIASSNARFASTRDRGRPARRCAGAVAGWPCACSSPND